MTQNTTNAERAREIAEKLSHAESAEDFAAIVEESGVEIDAAQAGELLQESGELSDEALDNVAGGFLYTTMMISVYNAWQSGDLSTEDLQKLLELAAMR